MFGDKLVTETDFEIFHQRVLESLHLQDQLRGGLERSEFIHSVVALGQEQGCHFTAEDVATAMQASRRAWIEQWL
jgi:hypothetical protein